MRRSLAIAILVLQLSVLLLGALPQGLYALYPSMFAAHCVNKAKPAMQCQGKCQMRKATASALGVATGHSLRAETPVRLEMPCTSPEEVAFAMARGDRPELPDITLHATSRTSSPEIPPPRTI